jgi:hypothetical protein
MKFFSRRGGEQAERPAGEAMVVETLSTPDKVVDSGSLDVIDRREMPVELVKARIATRQEWVRAILAILFVLLLALIVIWAFLRTDRGPDTIDLLDRILPAVTGLLGSVVGFYFATRH